ncbi:MAG: NFACT family protein [Clostridia bacterium]|nr:NFACT family protein [Clostridia bacterium]
MALDGGMIYCLAAELREALDGVRVDKIHQPSREELVLALRGKAGTKKLYLSSRVQSARVHLADATPENPASPPMFCMLLRKHLTGGKLAAIRQDGLERVLYFDFDCINELGDVVRLTLAAEMTGRHSNLVLIGGDGRVIDAIKRVDPAMNEERPIVPSAPYQPPRPLPDRLSPLDADRDRLVEAVKRCQASSLSDALLRTTQGLSPLVCREVASLTLRKAEKRPDELTDEEWERLAFFVGRVRETLLTGERRVPYLIRTLSGEPQAFCYMPITQYGLSAVGSEAASFSKLLEEFYAEKDSRERLAGRAHDILKILVNASARIERKLEKQREELARSGDRDKWRLYGDLLIAQAYAVPPGADEATVMNYYDENGGTITIPLDPSRSAAANAQRYYKEYRKAQTAERVLTEVIASGEAELRYLDSVLDALSRASSMQDIAEVRQELIDGGYIRHTEKRKRPTAPAEPLRFRSSDGTLILVGRNNLQNDRLTLKVAKGSDLWLHTKNIPGSHVIIRLDGAAVTETALHEAAVLAATHSKAAASAQVPVDYTFVKFVHKPAGAKPGMVIYEHQQTQYVTPDEALLKRLREL